MGGDIKLIRVDPLGAYAMINDSVKTPHEEHLSALRAYEIEPLLWSHKDESLAMVNGGH